MSILGYCGVPELSITLLQLHILKC